MRLNAFEKAETVQVRQFDSSEPSNETFHSLETGIVQLLQILQKTLASVGGAKNERERFLNKKIRVREREREREF
jgi:hypothetical protein